MVARGASAADIAKLDEKVASSRHALRTMRDASERSKKRRINARIFLHKSAQALYMLVRTVAGGLGDALDLHWKPDPDVALATNFQRAIPQTGSGRENASRRRHILAGGVQFKENHTVHGKRAMEIFPHPDDLLGERKHPRPNNQEHTSRVDNPDIHTGGRMAGLLGQRLPMDERYNVDRRRNVPDEEQPDNPDDDLPVHDTDFSYFATFGSLLGDEFLSAFRLAVANIRSMDNGRFQKVRITVMVGGTNSSVRLAQLIEALVVRRRQQAGRIWPRKELLAMHTTTMLAAYEYFRNGPVDPEFEA